MQIRMLTRGICILREGMRLHAVRKITDRGTMLCDSGLLSLVVALSLVLYVRHLGFYSDDWAFLAALDLPEDKSTSSLFVEMMVQHGLLMRPTQSLYLVLLYKLFGLEALGYHLVNAVIMIANAILFYLCLSKLRQPRLIALAVPLVYILLPHYSTDRFWMAAFQVPLSMAFYFLSLYFDLKAVATERARFAVCKAFSMAALLVSALAYETVLPLFLINPLLVWYVARVHRARPIEEADRRSISLVLYGGNPVLVGLVFAYKIIFNQRGEASFLAENPIMYLALLAYRMIDPIRAESDYGFNLWQFIGVDFIDRGLKLPLVALDGFLQGYVAWSHAVVAGLVGVLVFAHLYCTTWGKSESLICRREWLEIVGAGLATSLAGYAIFFIVSNIQFTLGGIGNRVSMSAAAGIAVVYVGVIGWTVSRLSNASLRRAAFASLIALLTTSGCLVNYAIASFWITAFEHQNRVLAAIQDEFHTLPRGGTLILDGVCPYVGPGIVFESNWDLAGALQLLYRDQTLSADVATPKLKVTRHGLETMIYGEVTKHAYGPDLIIYNVARNTNRRLVDAAAAEDYFAGVGTGLSRDCPSASEGVGVPIF